MRAAAFTACLMASFAAGYFTAVVGICRAMQAHPDRWHGHVDDFAEIARRNRLRGVVASAHFN